MSDGGSTTVTKVLWPARLSSVAAIPFFGLYLIASSATTGNPTFVLAAASTSILAVFGGRTGLIVFARFLPLLVMAAIFLTLIHVIIWSPFSVDTAGLHQAATFLGRLVVIFAAISLLNACINREELFATFVLFRVPSPMIFGIFRAFWILSKIPKRASDILLAQRMRGVRFGGPISKIHAIGAALHALINSTLLELEESVFGLVSRGIFQTGRKVSLTRVRLGPADAIYAGFASAGLVLALAFDGQFL